MTRARFFDWFLVELKQNFIKQQKIDIDKEPEMNVKKGDILCIWTGKFVDGQRLKGAAEAMKKGDASFLVCPHCGRPFASAEKKGLAAMVVGLTPQHRLVTEVSGQK